MRNICIIQPILTNYRLPVFLEIAKYCHLSVIYSATTDVGQGFGNLQQLSEIDEIEWFKVPTKRPFGERVCLYQSGIIDILRKIQPDAVIIFSNLRYLSFWTILLWCKLRNISIFLHGHGLYKKTNAKFFWQQTYRILLKLSTRYICYTPYVADSMLNLGLPKNKLAIAENSLSNQYPVVPEEKNGMELGVIFIGRLRPGCGLKYLIKAITRLHLAGFPDVELHIIGDGEKFSYFGNLCNKMSWAHFYGECYDQKKISEISRKCCVGCYPGNAGLSVVHMFSLSLPPITHNNMQHQGPEPSYIVSGENGLLFEQNKPEQGILDALLDVFYDPQKLKQLQTNAYETYEELTKPSLAMRMFNIINSNKK